MSTTELDVTSRDLRAIDLLSRGFGLQEAGRAIRLSRWSFKNYLCRLRDKVGVQTTTELIAYALRNRWIE